MTRIVACLKCTGSISCGSKTNHRRYCDLCLPARRKEVQNTARKIKRSKDRLKLIKTLVPVHDVAADSRRYGPKPVYRDPTTQILYRKDGPRRFIKLVSQRALETLFVLMLMVTGHGSRAQDVMRPPENISMSVLQPPARFNHRYKGKTVEYLMPLDAARYMCSKQGVKADSCSWTRASICYTVIPTDGPVKDRAQYRSHEIAHCNGWTSRHEK